MSRAIFESELLGGSFERRYRRQRPDIEAMPWGTIDLARMSEVELIASRSAWTHAAFQEHRTGIACAAALRAMLEIQAPIDMVALATRFPLDEIAHAELCARVAMELGGGTEIAHDPDELFEAPSPEARPLLRTTELLLRVFCIGEAFSVPMLRAAWRAARHPLPRSIWGRIVKDEAAHGALGFLFLDWVLPRLDGRDLAHLGGVADATLARMKRRWSELEAAIDAPSVFGFLSPPAFVVAARAAITESVVRPLLARDVPLSAEHHPS